MEYRRALNIKETMQIIEVAFELNHQHEYDFLETLFTRLGIAYYIEPPREKPWNSLAECEADCEGK